VLKHEVALLPRELLPLQQGLIVGNAVAASPITLIVFNTHELGNELLIQAGILYQSIIAGCSCADDPTPINENNEYCTVSLRIDKATAEMTVMLLDEERS